MADKGFDVGALLQLQAQRDEVSSKIEAFIAERERLEAQPWALCAGGPDGLPEESSQDTEHGRTREAEEVEAQLLPRPLPPLVDPDGRKGRVVLNHSTHVPRLIDVLNKLGGMRDISTVCMYVCMYAGMYMCVRMKIYTSLSLSLSLTLS